MTFADKNLSFFSKSLPANTNTITQTLLRARHDACCDNFAMAPSARKSNFLHSAPEQKTCSINILVHQCPNIFRRVEV